MQTTIITGVNIAPDSTSGHYVQGAIKVVDLDNIKQTYLVEGKSKLVTKNHTDLKLEESCLITTQMVYNPFAKMFEKSYD